MKNCLYFTDRRPASLEWLVQGDESREEEDSRGKKAGIQSNWFTGDTSKRRALSESKPIQHLRLGPFTHYVMQQLDFSALGSWLDESDYPTVIQEQAQAWISAGFYGS